MNTSKPINVLIEEFLSEADCKMNTIDTYRRNLRIWVEWMVKNADIVNPTKSDIIRYKHHLIESVKITTVDSYVASVKMLFKWLCEKHIHDNIASGIKWANKSDEHRTGSLSEDQVSRLLSTMGATTEMEKRNYAIVNLMLFTGLRCVEVTRLSVGDLTKRESGYNLRVHRKGRNEKDATICIPDSAADPVIDYISHGLLMGGSDVPIFRSLGSCPDKRISTKTIGRIVMDAVNSIGVTDKRITGHSMRHTAALCALRGGATVYAIQQMLGHRNPETTMIYLRELEQENTETTTAIGILDRVYNIDRKPSINDV